MMESVMEVSCVVWVTPLLHPLISKNNIPVASQHVCRDVFALEHRFSSIVTGFLATIVCKSSAFATPGLLVQLFKPRKMMACERECQWQ